jgi:hypothetical protein
MSMRAFNPALPPFRTVASSGGTEPIPEGALLLEDGDNLLLETGDNLLLG